jgi:hypothetical protein
MRQSNQGNFRLELALLVARGFQPGARQLALASDSCIRKFFFWATGQDQQQSLSDAGSEESSTT